MRSYSQRAVSMPSPQRTETAGVEGALALRLHVPQEPGQERDDALVVRVLSYVRRAMSSGRNGQKSPPFRRCAGPAGRKKPPDSWVARIASIQRLLVASAAGPGWRRRAAYERSRREFPQPPSSVGPAAGVHGEEVRALLVAAAESGELESQLAGRASRGR